MLKKKKKKKELRGIVPLWSLHYAFAERKGRLPSHCLKRENNGLHLRYTKHAKNNNAYRLFSYSVLLPIVFWLCGRVVLFPLSLDSVCINPVFFFFFLFFFIKIREVLNKKRSQPGINKNLVKLLWTR